MKNLNRWLGSYILQSIQRRIRPIQTQGTVHIMFAFVDHYEPDWNNANPELQRQRVQNWLTQYPSLAKDFKDADGCHPKHTFFYPAECYTAEHLDMLSELCRQGIGEVEVHLHHNNDTRDTLKKQLEQAKTTFARHGLLGKRTLSGHIRFAFIHGNWCLNNSRKDGQWCGVNDESRVLAESGCYADFTFPSAPSETQPRKINSIYYTSSSPKKSKTHNKGNDVTRKFYKGGDLMIVQGPLTLNWTRRSKGIFPRIENGDITGYNPPTEDRVDLWIKQHIHVIDKPEWIFVKIHTHGAHEANAKSVLGDAVRNMHTYLNKKYNDGERYQLHYVSAREMYNIIKAAEAGEQGDPGEYRNYLIEANP